MGQTDKQESCFADVNGECSALKVKDCEGCGFYKTTKEVERGRKKAMLRIKSLGKDITDYIIDKYYKQEV